MRLSLALAPLALAAPSPGQTLVYELEGLPWTVNAVSHAVGVGDVDGDGYGDLLVGDAGAVDPATSLAGGVALLLDGGNAQQVAAWYGDEGTDSFGASVSPAGDVDLDGLVDFVVGDPTDGNVAPFGVIGTGSATVLSGASGQVLLKATGPLSSRFGELVVSAGDVDADGVPDLLVAAPGDGTAGLLFGMAYLLSGATGGVLRAHPGDAALAVFPTAIAGTGDVDGDGHDDYALSDSGELSGRGRARVHSGASGAVLHELVGAQLGDALGARLGGPGDLSGDGVPDLLVSAPGVDLGAADAGALEARSGADGAVLWTHLGTRPDDRMYAAVAPGDVDGDGVPDAATAGRLQHVIADPWCPVVWTTGQGYVDVLSGASGVPLLHLVGAQAGDELGWGWLAAAGDVNGDGAPELCVGLPRQDQFEPLYGCTWFAPGPPLLRVVSTVDLPLASDVHELSLSAGGAQALTLLAGAAHASEGYLVTGSTSGSLPGIALGGVHVPLNPDATTLALLADLAHPWLGGWAGLLGASGDSVATLALPSGALPSLAGLTLHAAFVTTDGFALEFASNAVPLTFLP